MNIIIELVKLQNFTLYKQFSVFGLKLAKNDISGLNQKAVKIAVEFSIFKYSQYQILA